MRGCDDESFECSIVCFVLCSYISPTAWFSRASVRLSPYNRVCTVEGWYFQLLPRNIERRECQSQAGRLLKKGAAHKFGQGRRLFRTTDKTAVSRAEKVAEDNARSRTSCMPSLSHRLIFFQWFFNFFCP